MIRTFWRIGYLLFFILAAGQSTNAQAYGNEWIDYNKTYYRFLVTPNIADLPGAAGNNDDLADYGSFYRVPYAVLLANGLAGTPVEYFQLLRKGKEVPLYTYPASGIMTPDGYLEFWAEPNDGKDEQIMYRDQDDQLNDRWSLFSDSLWYYLAVNAQTANKRITDQANAVNPQNQQLVSTISHKLNVNFRFTKARGYERIVSGKSLQSSAFDSGEGWARNVVQPYTATLTNMAVDASAAATYSLNFAYAGSANAVRNITVRMNNNIVWQKLNQIAYNDEKVTLGNLPIANLLADNNDINFQVSQAGITVHKLQVQYPRKLIFDGNSKAFVFELPASANERLLRFVNFNTALGNQYLVDLTNGKRYAAVRDNDSSWIAIPALGAASRFVFYVSPGQLTTRYVNTVSSLKPRQFINYNQPAQQGNYVIISNKILYESEGTNPVMDYAAMRGSAVGGSFSPKVFEVEELFEQFGGGVPSMPMAIRNFCRFAFEQFVVKPKYAFLIGHGLTYRADSRDSIGKRLNLIPTWGDPASDNLFTAFYGSQVMPQIPIGRLSAVNGNEVKGYLEKMKRYLQEQQSGTDKQWQKETLHLIGGTDATIIEILDQTMNVYKNIIIDTLIGSNVLTVKRLNDPNTSENNQKIKQRLETGAGFISYFGHSSTTSFDFNLNDPEALDYTSGRYSTMLANGCNASEFYNYSEQRASGQSLTLSEKWVLYPEGGTVSFISSSSYGVLQHLSRFSDLWYKSLSRYDYGKSIGLIHQRAIDSTYRKFGLNDDEFSYRRTTEQFVIHGDPAIIMHTQQKADYAIDSLQTNITNSPIAVTTDSIQVKLTVTNNGKVNPLDTVAVVAFRNFPDGSRRQVWQTKLLKMANSKTVLLNLPVKGIGGAGANSLDFVVDPDNLLDESTLQNNTLKLPFTIDASLVYAGYPKNFAIVNSWPISFYAFAGHVMESSAIYRYQLDTTLLFNSPLKYEMDIQQSGGTLKFIPQNAVLPNTVYYWRAAKLINNNPGTWSSSSFTYLPSSTEGFNQAHYFQWLQNSFTQLRLPEDRKLALDSSANNIYVSHGIFPTSGTEDSHFSLSRNGLQDIQSACVGSSIIFNVFDSSSFIPWRNNPSPNGMYNSTISNCANGRQNNFEYSIKTAATRKHAMDFMDLIVPDGHFVVARLVVDQPYENMNALAWAADTALFGSGQSLYHSLKRQGFATIDSANGPRTFSFIFKKNGAATFAPVYRYSAGLFDRPIFDADIPMPDTIGSMLTQPIGPAASWERIQWQHLPNAFDSDTTEVQVYGVKSTGVAVKLFSLNESKADTVLSQLPLPAIDANVYPYLQLKFETRDKQQAKAGETGFMRVSYAGLPEAAIMPNEYFLFAGKTGARNTPDTVDAAAGNTIFGVAFRNISSKTFADSIPVTVQLEDVFGNIIPVKTFKIKPLAADDSVNMQVQIAINALSGHYKLFVVFNKNRTVPEEQLQNNFLYHDFVVTNAVSGIKYYNGTGLWSNAANWLPAGVPVCSDKVVVNGAVTVDIANAVADSVAINPGGQLIVNNSNSNLMVGCNAANPKALLMLRGALTIGAGTVQVNGAMFISNGSIFNQSGGNIIINANNGVNSAGVTYVPVNGSNTGIPAIFSIGGRSAVPGIYGVFNTGSITASGGNIYLVNPPPSNAGAALHVRTTIPVMLGSQHTLFIGADSAKNTRGNPDGFSMYIDAPSVVPAIQFGTLYMNTGGKTGRKVWITGTTGSIMDIRKRAEAAANASVELDSRIQINIKTEQ